ncbi:hypothetical protein AVEN_34011-1 [Araneus ventricosus]|uniref:Endonuclease/exonuclease/phosphatase domain-containing protein n=1 Tax=Araneus ventricosus TaxID=182803 RepID=A0A4Y2TE01_ARAVE|nr:hypothetical protein AVEN_34011-1 [Araneus ventricosus]
MKSPMYAPLPVSSPAEYESYSAMSLPPCWTQLSSRMECENDSLAELSSDHNPVILKFDLNTAPLLKNRRKVSTNWGYFKTHLNSNVKLLTLSISNNDDLDNEISKLTENITNEYNSSSKPLKEHEELYLPPYIRKLKTERNRAKRVWQRDRNPTSKNQYNRAQTRFRPATDEFNHSTYAAQISQLNVYDCTLWKRIKSLKNKRSIIPRLSNPRTNALAHTASEKAEVIATHFQSQFTLNALTDLNTEKTVQNSIESFQQYTLPVKFKMSVPQK